VIALACSDDVPSRLATESMNVMVSILRRPPSLPDQRRLPGA
jgi:hypothetical protein